jgi:hypothetical protein
MDLKFIRAIYKPVKMEKVVLVSKKEETTLKTISLEELMGEKIVKIGSYFWDNSDRYIPLGELQNKINPSITPDDYKEILKIFEEHSERIFESAKFTRYGEFYSLKRSYGKKYPDYEPNLDRAITRRIIQKE